MAGEEVIGGLTITTRVSTEDILPGMAKLDAALTGMETKLAKTGTVAATATSRIDAGMRSATKGSSGFGYQLQLLGQGLDDLQYVGEMGLRPIINNLMQIHPAVGIIAIAIDQARKNGDGWVESLTNVASAFAEVAGVEFDMSQGVSEFDTLIAAANKFVNYVKNEVPKAWGELSGSTARGQQAEIDAFLKGGSKADKARGQGIADAVAEYGADRFFADMIDPMLLAGNNPEVLRQEQKSLMDLVKKGASGDRAAQDELIARTTGTPVGAQIWASLPETKDWKKADAEKAKAAKKKETDEWNAWVGDQDPEEYWAEDAPGAKKKSQAELDRKISANVSGFLKDDAAMVRLQEREGDLNWKLMGLMNPERQGQTLGGDSYAGSFHSTTGLSEEAKRLHAIEETNKEIAENTRKMTALNPGVRPR